MKIFVTIILAVILPLLGMTQAQKFQSVKLRTLDQRTVDPVEIFQDNNLTIVYFFNENCRHLTDQLDYLENLAEEYGDDELKIIAVYNASNNSNYGQIKPILNGNDIDIETLIDVNGELQRAMGLTVNSPVILTRYTNMHSGSYVHSVSYTPEQADVELSQLLAHDYQESYSDPYYSDNISEK